MKSKVSFRLLVSGAVGCIVLVSVMVGSGLFREPPELGRLQSVAKPGNHIKEVVSRFGEPDSIASLDSGGRTLRYKTQIDWDKFVEYRVCVIAVDATGVITNVDIQLSEYEANVRRAQTR